MKRSKWLLEKDPPKLAESESIIYIRLRHKRFLLCDIRQDSDNIRCRYIIDIKTGYHYWYDWNKKIWKYSSILAACGYISEGYYYASVYSIKSDFEWIIAEDKASAAADKARRPQDILYNIDSLENHYRNEQAMKAETRRRKKIDDLHAQVPALPRDFKKWIRTAAGENKHYYLKNADLYTCSKCHNSVTKIRMEDRCPACGAKLKAARTDKVETWTYAFIFQKYSGGIIERCMDVCFSYTLDAETVHISESHRAFIKDNDYWLFYNQCHKEDTGAYWDVTNPTNRRTKTGYLYPKGIEEPGLAMETRMLRAIADSGQKLNTAVLYWLCDSPQRADLIEISVKNRFFRFINDITNEGMFYYSRIDKLEEIYELDKQTRNRLRDLNGGYKTLEWLKWAKGRHIGDRFLKWCEEERIYVDDVKFILDRMSPEQVMNYLIRQKKEFGRSIHSIIEIWEDYLDMDKKAGKNTSDPMVYRPKDLKLRHDQAVEAARQREAIAEAKRNKAAAKRREAELKKKYPGASGCLPEIRQKYEYENDTYKVLAPKSLYEIVQEGYALHHCVGATDRYFERMERAETYILFLRKKESPDAPFYTMEVEPGGTIRQHRSFYDEEPDIKDIRGFLREWQRVIKTRLTAADRKAAEESRRLGELNLEELLRTKGKNDRVYKALLEDYLEAM